MATTSTGPTRSILKQRTPNKASDEEKAKAEKDQRNLSIALSHAHKIQSQKQAQLQIVQNIETLLDLPSTPPSPQDARTFTTLLHPFQPSDFASLVEERTINGSCGYALCPNHPRSATLGPSASWRLKGKGAGDFCSTACVRKALYVKAQLSGVPAWERVSGQQGRIILSESMEGRVGGAAGTNEGVNEGGGGGGPEGVGAKVANSRELAAERGEEATSFRPRQVMMDSVVEKTRSKTTASAPSLPQRSLNDSQAGAIEGYESKFSFKRGDDEDDSDGDGNDDGDGPSNAQAVGFTSEVKTEDDNDFDAEEEEAWRELQAGLRHLNTAHDR